MTPEIRVGDTWLSTVAAVGDHTLNWRYPGGSYAATWTLGLRPMVRPPFIYRDAPITIHVGGSPVWSGVLDEPDWSSGTFTARGDVRTAEDAIALTATGTTTTTPNIAIDQAYARGAITFKRGETFSTTPHTVEDTASLNKVSDLLDDWAESSTNENGPNWYVDARRLAWLGYDPNVPNWHIVPDVVELGIATEVLASRLVGLWESSNGLLHRTMVGEGRPEVAIDLTNLGAITTTQATNRLNRVLKKVGPEAGGWANTITVTSGQIISPGGLHPLLAQVGETVARGALVRILGHPDPRAGATYRPDTDVIIEEAEWNPGEGTLTLTPRGTAERDLTSIVENIGGALA